MLFSWFSYGQISGHNTDNLLSPLFSNTVLAMESEAEALNQLTGDELEGKVSQKQRT